MNIEVYTHLTLPQAAKQAAKSVRQIKATQTPNPG